MRLKVRVGEVECIVELFPDSAPKTVERVLEALPIESEAMRWGDEVYFHTDVDVDVEENFKDTVEIGDVAYWKPGKAICLFFGKTPISDDDKIKPASPVNVFGRILSGLDELHSVKDGDPVRVERLD